MSVFFKCQLLTRAGLLLNTGPISTRTVEAAQQLSLVGRVMAQLCPSSNRPSGSWQRGGAAEDRPPDDMVAYFGRCGFCFYIFQHFPPVAGLRWSGRSCPRLSSAAWPTTPWRPRTSPGTHCCCPAGPRLSSSLHRSHYKIQPEDPLPPGRPGGRG